MTLGFSNKINGAASFFVYKIWLGLLERSICNGDQHFHYLSSHIERFGKQWDHFPSKTVDPKIHTIRIDKNNKWKAGNKIHFVTGNRTPSRFQFAPIIPAISVQEIEIKNMFLDSKVLINGRILRPGEVLELALNDGFDSYGKFWDFFGQDDFKGKLIHWTDKIY